jgi:hypothetical protein
MLVADSGWSGGPGAAGHVGAGLGGQNPRGSRIDPRAGGAPFVADEGHDFAFGGPVDRIHRGSAVFQQALYGNESSAIHPQGGQGQPAPPGQPAPATPPSGTDAYGTPVGNLQPGVGPSPAGSWVQGPSGPMWVPASGPGPWYPGMGTGGGFPQLAIPNAHLQGARMRRFLWRCRTRVFSR